MASNARVPEAEITGIFGAMAKRFSKKKLGVALGIEAQGFAAACGLKPLAMPSTS
jgi:hypothetical protein